MSERPLGLRTATLVIVASMVGTGVFTTTGLLAARTPHPTVVLLTWAVGAVLALCGALSYAELGARFPASGGEYRLLYETLGPLPGFVAGWVSVIVGFAAPIAAAAVAFGSYLHRAIPSVPVLGAALVLVALTALVATAKTQATATFQNVTTALKVLLILALVAALLPALNGAFFTQGSGSIVRHATSYGFATGLVLVAYAYTGWNAALYFAGQIERPAHNIPRSVTLGTLIVAGLYLALNIAFIGAAGIAPLNGVVEVAHVAAEAAYGPSAASFVSIVIALGLVSTVGALTWSGVYVLEAMAKDFRVLGAASTSTPKVLRQRACLVQTGLALVFLLSMSFEAMLTYVGVCLTLTAAMTVFASLVATNAPGGVSGAAFRAPLRPAPQVIFLAFAGWMVVSAVTEVPISAAYSAATLVAGAIVYVVVRRRKTDDTANDSAAITAHRCR